MNNQKRLKFLLVIIGVGFLAGILCSHELWFPITRTFPRAPIFFEAPEAIVLYGERLLSAILLASLLALIFIRRKQLFLILAIASLFLLIAFDQNRLQPWVYQYSLILIVFALLHRLPTEKSDESIQQLGLIQILITGLYIWSGLQKMNYTFSHETLPFILAPVQNLFPSIQLPHALLGIFLALTELFVGAGLLFRKTRNICVWLAIIMHLTILGLLIGQNYNSIVWVWNATLIAAVFFAFWKSNVSVRDVITRNGQKDWRNRVAQVIVALSVLLPTLNFFGWWDA